MIVSLFAVAVSGYGQDEADDRKLTVDVGADLVSAYVWRGMYMTGVSIQPSLSLSACGLTIEAWGSTDFSASFKELDFMLSYEMKGFSATIGDYWWKGEGESYFRNQGSHHLEVTLGYTFSEKFPLSLEVNTMFTGDEDKDDAGRKYYSTYIAARYPFTVGNINFETGIGVSPWKGIYYHKVAVATITAKASKNIQITKKYALPVFAELIFAPAQDNAYLVFGIKF